MTYASPLSQMMAAARPAQSGLMGPAAGTRDMAVAAREFAGIFYSMMMSEMQKTVPDSPYSGGRGEEVFRSLWVNEIGGRMAARKDDPLVTAIVNAAGTGGTRGAGNL